jgi:small nuclear ribonucleoprotein D3
MSSIGIPVKLLHESSGHIVTLELKTGATYRGKLLDAEDNMNIQLKDITVTARDGRVSQLDQVYIRGSQVRFFIVPDMLKVCRISGVANASVECANVQDV